MVNLSDSDYEVKRFSYISPLRNSAGLKHFICTGSLDDACPAVKVTVIEYGDAAAEVINAEFGTSTHVDGSRVMIVVPAEEPQRCPLGKSSVDYEGYAPAGKQHDSANHPGGNVFHRGGDVLKAKQSYILHQCNCMSSKIARGVAEFIFGIQGDSRRQMSTLTEWFEEPYQRF